MTVGSLGSVGMGLVWGWLLVLARGFRPARRPLRTTIVLILATTIFAQQLHAFAGGQKLLLFLVAAVISLVLHLGWRRAMQNK